VILWNVEEEEEKHFSKTDYTAEFGKKQALNHHKVGPSSYCC
jgi:hypothetical protein